MKVEWGIILVGLALIVIAMNARAMDTNAFGVDNQVTQAIGGVSGSIGTITDGIFGLIATVFKGLIGMITLGTGWTEKRASIALTGIVLLILAWTSKGWMDWFRAMGQYIMIAMGILLIIISYLGI